jgi:hypothetical protein
MGVLMLRFCGVVVPVQWCCGAVACDSYVVWWCDVVVVR